MALTDKEYRARMKVWSETNERLEAMGEAPALWGDVRDYLDGWDAESLTEHIKNLRS